MVFKKSNVREFRRHWHNIKESCARFEGVAQCDIAWVLTESRDHPVMGEKVPVARLAVAAGASATGMLKMAFQPQTWDLVRTRSRKARGSKSSSKSKA
jgi:hypothetical protein